MPDVDKITALEEKIADLRKRNASLQATADQRGRRVAMLEGTVAELQDRLDRANGF